MIIKGNSVGCPLPDPRNGLDMKDNRINNVANPEESGDAANKDYVDLSVAAIKAIVDKLAEECAPIKRHRVGAWYFSSDPESPASFFGGTWEMISDRFLVGAGGSYANGETGGAATVALTVSQMPKHTHDLVIASGTNTGVYSTDQLGCGKKVVSSNSGERNYTNDNAIESAGSGSAHNNLPPYFALYMWRRVA